MTTIPLTPGHYYHIYNRGINGEALFKERKNYNYFLKQYSAYIGPIADTFAYCLLPNHFHFLVRIKEQNKAGADAEKPGNPSRCFSHLFNSYSQSINKAYKRHGSLFERPFKRKEIDSDAWFYQLLYYIHLNPVKHRISRDYVNYPHSSYHSLLANKETRLERDAVWAWFGGVENFIEYHTEEHDLFKIRHLLLED